MKIYKQSGFAMVELLIILVVAAVIGAAGYLVIQGRDKKTGDKMTAEQITADEARRMGGDKGSSSTSAKLPVLQNLLGITFGPYDAAAQRSGDFVFTKDAAQQASAPGNMIFFPFGQNICGQSGCKILTEMEWRGLRPDTPIKAAATGKVVGMRNEGSDYSFATVSDDYPGYSVGYDHLAAPKFKEGDTIKAGDVIGTAALTGKGPFARIELFVKKDGPANANSTTKLCPVDLLAVNAKTAIVADLRKFFTDWNTFIGSEVYKPADMSTVGCISKETTE